ncbi:type III toxin-antitoxin system ToxN/AbiQ family toxin [Tissierella carlieri]|nr:type III toxin-antitoxin system ToxN/AbiQ family toxin [Tissierella carlieri]
MIFQYKDIILTRERYDSINVKKNNNEKRVYIGIVFQINNIKYFAPLASPRPKHSKMKDNIDFIKINNGEHGAINLNNIIPVVNEGIINYNINKEPNITYRNLLYQQVGFINKNTERIINNANKLYEKVTKYNTFFKFTLCKFQTTRRKMLGISSLFRNT